MKNAATSMLLAALAVVAGVLTAWAALGIR